MEIYANSYSIQYENSKILQIPRIIYDLYTILYVLTNVSNEDIDLFSKISDSVNNLTDFMNAKSGGETYTYNEFKSNCTSLETRNKTMISEIDSFIIQQIKKESIILHEKNIYKYDNNPDILLTNIINDIYDMSKFDTRINQSFYLNDDIDFLKKNYIDNNYRMLSIFLAHTQSYLKYYIDMDKDLYTNIESVLNKMEMDDVKMNINTRDESINLKILSLVYIEKNNYNSQEQTKLCNLLLQLKIHGLPNLIDIFYSKYRFNNPRNLSLLKEILKIEQFGEQYIGKNQSNISNVLLLYRGNSEGFDKNIFNINDHTNELEAHSLSYNCSILNGIIRDKGACTYMYFVDNFDEHTQSHDEIETPIQLLKNNLYNHIYFIHNYEYPKHTGTPPFDLKFKIKIKGLFIEIQLYNELHAKLTEISQMNCLTKLVYGIQNLCMLAKRLLILLQHHLVYYKYYRFDPTTEYLIQKDLKLLSEASLLTIPVTLSFEQEFEFNLDNLCRIYDISDEDTIIPYINGVRKKPNVHINIQNPYISQNMFFIPPLHPLGQMFGSGELWHARSKIYKDFNTIHPSAFDELINKNNLPDFYKSEFDKEIMYFYLKQFIKKRHPFSVSNDVNDQFYSAMFGGYKKYYLKKNITE
jgi:hypothetical protein